MGKRKYSVTENRIARQRRQGRGAGHGDDYRPWLTIQDVPSTGVSIRNTGLKSERVHQYLSKNEWRFAMLLDWSDDVTDFREQFPLDSDETQWIAQKLNITHPKNNKTGTPIVMTTDFLIDITDASGKFRSIARTVKPADELNKPRVIEKFQIEYEYWKQHKVDWGIVTEQELDQTSCTNLEWILPCYRLDIEEGQSGALSAVIEHMKACVAVDRELSIAALCAGVDHQFNLASGTGLLLMRHLLAHKAIRFNLRQPLNARTLAGSLTVPDDENDETVLRRAM